MNFPMTQDEPLSFGIAAESPPEMNLAPFIDIVLQLICFYVFVAGAMQHYSDPTVNLPRMASRDTREQQPAEVVINIKQDGAVTLNDRPVAPDQVGLMLLERRRTRGVLDAAELRVSIRVDREQRYAALGDVLKACREAELGRIALRVEEISTP